MKVKTIRDHYRAGEFKSGSAGPVYDVPDIEAETLISRNLVEVHDEAGDEAEGVQGTGQGAVGAAGSDGTKQSSKGGKSRA